MIITRSKSPLRLGLAGGGTDVSPYCDIYGGSVLNATINLYVHCTIELKKDNDYIDFRAHDLKEYFKEKLAPSYDLQGPLILHKAIYNKIIQKFNNNVPLPVKITTWSDALPGSGLGTSSTLVVAILAAFRQLLSLPIGEYELASMAYEIERQDCNLAGGKQDQYATTFGGFNFMEFYNLNKVIVNPLRIRRHIENELQESMLLFFTGRSRESACIIEDQIDSLKKKDKKNTAIEAMHEVKQLAFHMKEYLLKGDIPAVHEILKGSWEAKKRMASKVSNPEIDTLVEKALEAGARAVKISGAGGGGFMMMFVDPIRKLDIIRAFSELPGQFRNFQFSHQGVEAWTVR